MRIRFGDCLLDLERRLLERRGEHVHLSPKGFAVLEVLVAERPRPVSKRILLERVWPDVVVEDQNVKNTIVEIRAALGDEADSIRTVQKFGYAFAADVFEERGPSAEILYWLQSSTRPIPVTSPRAELGRDPQCEIFIDLPGVSRRHAVITKSGESAQIEDLGSKNGTRVDGDTIAGPVILRDGSQIRLGSAIVTFRLRRGDATLTEGE